MTMIRYRKSNNGNSRVYEISEALAREAYYETYESPAATMRALKADNYNYDDELHKQLRRRTTSTGEVANGWCRGEDIYRFTIDEQGGRNLLRWIRQYKEIIVKQYDEVELLQGYSQPRNEQQIARKKYTTIYEAVADRAVALSNADNTAWAHDPSPAVLQAINTHLHSPELALIIDDLTADTPMVLQHNRMRITANPELNEIVKDLIQPHTSSYGISLALQHLDIISPEIYETIHRAIMDEPAPARDQVKGYRDIIHHTTDEE